MKLILTLILLLIIIKLFFDNKKEDFNQDINYDAEYQVALVKSDAAVSALKDTEDISTSSAAVAKATAAASAAVSALSKVAEDKAESEKDPDALTVSSDVIAKAANTAANAASTIAKFAENKANKDKEIVAKKTKEKEEAEAKVVAAKTAADNNRTTKPPTTTTQAPTTTIQSNNQQKLYEFNYTGKTQVLNVSNIKKIKIEVWGAAGGSLGGQRQIEGGFSSGDYTIPNDVKELYIEVGGRGVDPTGDFTPKRSEMVPGGYNGGGKGGFDGSHGGSHGASGGGATDVRLKNGDLNSRIIVAGGGGGTNQSSNYGGKGGGENGENGYTRENSSWSGYGEGGTQSSGGKSIGGEAQLGQSGSFGQGGDGASGFNCYGSGGGGGGWYGGGGGAGKALHGAGYGGAGGGGSGYIGKVENGVTNRWGKFGDGSCKITVLEFKDNNKQMLYEFKEHTFTTASKTGHKGPTLQEVKQAYSGISWAQNSEFFNMKKQGIQEWRVPVTGNYKIQAVGAKGGGNLGGLGASVVSTFNLKKNDVLSIVVGQIGLAGTKTNNNGGGGGGASYVVNGSTLLIAAGGGGGGSENNRGANASTSTSGTSTLDNGGGINGNGGASGKTNGQAAGGAGWLSDGATGTEAPFAYGGNRYESGAEGGNGNINANHTGGSGGFGGGGGGWHNSIHRGGGGGGYSGGQGGTYSSNIGELGGGGGGGSYSITGKFDAADSNNNDKGKVIITLVNIDDENQSKIPFIPKFKFDSNEQMGEDGNYIINVRNGHYYPCINIAPGKYLNSSHYGVLLDNDITTGVDIEKYHIGGPWLPYIIYITLPVEKTFKGVFKLDLLSPWGAQTLPRKISLATFNSNAFTQSWSGDNSKSRYESIDLPYRLENIDLPEVGNGSSSGPFNYSFDINFTKPFKHIALLIHSGWNQTGFQEGKEGAVWINNLEFLSVNTKDQQSEQIPYLKDPLIINTSTGPQNVNKMMTGRIYLIGASGTRSRDSNNGSGYGGMVIVDVVDAYIGLAIPGPSNAARSDNRMMGGKHSSGPGGGRDLGGSASSVAWKDNTEFLIAGAGGSAGKLGQGGDGGENINYVGGQMGQLGKDGVGAGPSKGADYSINVGGGNGGDGVPPDGGAGGGGYGGGGGSTNSCCGASDTGGGGGGNRVLNYKDCIKKIIYNGTSRNSRNLLPAELSNFGVPPDNGGVIYFVPGDANQPKLMLKVPGKNDIPSNCDEGDKKCQAKDVCEKVTGTTCVHQDYDCVHGNKGSWYPQGTPGGSTFNFAYAYDLWGGNYGNICTTDPSYISKYGLSKTYDTAGFSSWKRQEKKANEANQPKLMLKVDGKNDIPSNCDKGDHKCQAKDVCEKVTGTTCVHQDYDCVYGSKGSWYPQGTPGSSNFNFAYAYDLYNNNYGNICATDPSYMDKYGLAKNHQAAGLGRWTRQ